MKSKKLNWQVVVAGALLCAVLAVFIGSRIAEAQVTGVTGAKPRVLQRAATVNDVWEKLSEMEERLVRLEQKVDALDQKMDVALRVLKRLDRENK